MLKSTIKKAIGLLSIVSIIMIDGGISYADNITTFKENSYLINNQNKMTSKLMLTSAKKSEKKHITQSISIGNPIKKINDNIKLETKSFIAEFAIDSPLYVINGKVRKLDNTPININGNSFVPTRSIAELFDIEPEYIKEDQVIYLKHDQFSLLLSLENGNISYIKKGDKDAKVLDSLTLTHKGQNYIPIKALKEIGLDIKYCPTDKIITLQYFL